MSDQPLRVFLSYSREDFAFANRLAEDLSSAGVTAWLDKRDISPGQRWDNAVESGLTDADCVLAILSPAAVNSSNVLDEISLALETNKVIVPILYRDCAIPFRLRRVQYLDFRREYASAYQELLAVLTNEQRLRNRLSITNHKKAHPANWRPFTRRGPAFMLLCVLLAIVVPAVWFFIYRQWNKVPDISGEWHSEVFNDPNLAPPAPQQYYFKFKSDGGRLFGTVRYVEPPGKPTGIVYPAENGKIEGNKISFEYFGGWQHRDANGDTTPEKESFVGAISKGKIHFIYQREHATPFEFSATKIQDGPVDLSK